MLHLSFQGLKQCLDKILDRRIRMPCSTNADQTGIEGRILQTIIDFFANEAPPAFEVATYNRQPPWKSRQEGAAGGQQKRPPSGAAQQSPGNAKPGFAGPMGQRQKHVNDGDSGRP